MAPRGRKTPANDENNGPSPDEGKEKRIWDVDIWQHMKQIADSDWPNYTVHLYRKEPKVVGQIGRGKITEFKHSIDTEYITQMYGGGTFTIYFNHDVEPAWSRHEDFTLLAPAKLLPGQTFAAEPQQVGQAQPGGAAPGSTSGGAPVSELKILADSMAKMADRKSPQEMTMDAVIPMMSSGFGEVIKALASKPADGGGNALIGTILTAMMAQQAEMTKFMFQMMMDKNKAAPPSTDMLSGLLKSLPDLINQLKNVGIDIPSGFKNIQEILATRTTAPAVVAEGDGSEVSAVATITRELGPQLPAILDSFGRYQESTELARMRRANFDLDLAAKRKNLGLDPATGRAPTAAAGTTAPPPAPPAGPQFPPATGASPQTDGRIPAAGPVAAAPAAVTQASGGPAPVTAPATTTLPGGMFSGAPITTNGHAPAGEILPPEGSTNQEDAAANAKLDEICQRIVDLFEEERDGDAVAEAIDLMYPEVFEQIAPLLGNKDLAHAWVKTDPVLSQISGDPRFAKFFQEFMDYVNDVPEPETPTPAAV